MTRLEEIKDRIRKFFIVWRHQDAGKKEVLYVSAYDDMNFLISKVGELRDALIRINTKANKHYTIGDDITIYKIINTITQEALKDL